MSRWLLALALVVVAGSGHAAAVERLVIISVDGWRPEFYLPGSALATNCPNLVKLRDAGSYARSAIAVYPSMTYPGHASIVTGVNPERHGVTANTVFAPGEQGRGFWFASDLKAPALWDLAHAAGRKVGAVLWPTTGGAQTIAWNIAEFWTTAAGSQAQMMRQHSTPGLVGKVPNAADWPAWDQYAARQAVRILQDHRPDLLLVHFVEPDKVQHRGGRDAAELPAAMQRVDRLTAEVVAAAGAEATVIVVGDHGFSDVTLSVAPNILLAREGWITVTDGKVTAWRAFAENTGGSARVHLRDTADRAALVALLREAGRDWWEVTEGEPIWLEGRPGVMFFGSFQAKTVARRAPLKGNHGYRPEKPEMHTGFLAAGRGVRRGVVLEQMRLVDVAPTAAAWLGLEMKAVDGRVLTELITPAAE
jgi:predicted AlkP superfamily pyrophosphatase or phosphodiesterase